MHVRRFEGRDMAEALRKVREAFGPDALVLSTRSVERSERWLGRFGRRRVEVTAAVDRDVRRGGAPDSERRVAPDASWKELQLTRALVEPLECEVRALREAVEQLEPARSPGFAEEIAELRTLVGALGRRRGGPERACPPAVARLLAAGVAPEHARALGAEAFLRAAEGQGTDDALLETVTAHFEARLAPMREDDPPVALYVGPTGAGKTTTLAKVAAREARGAAGPALLTTDAHRLGADVALRGFARALELPFEVAVADRDVADAIRRAGRRRVLVDTAGRSPADGAALAELRCLRESLGRGAKVHLVVSATTNERELKRTLDWYRPLAPDALVVSKLDESGDLGGLANLLLDGDGPPLAWLANGQRVPDDLFVPDPRVLAAEILGVQP